MPDKLKITRVPGTNRLGPCWDAPEIPEGLRGLIELPEPDSVTFHHDDGTETTHLVSELDVEEAEGETARSLTRTIWKKNNGYPPGEVFVRPPDGVSTLEERLDVRMPKFGPSQTLKRRARAVAKAGGAAERRIIDAETEEERMEFQEYLEERKRRGPG